MHAIGVFGGDKLLIAEVGKYGVNRINEIE